MDRRIFYFFVGAILVIVAPCLLLNGLAQAVDGLGCLSCHEGIETINARMQPYLLSCAAQQFGKTVGFECGICHEGNPESKDMEEAHDGLVVNPSSMWVQHQGQGCSKCHQSKESLTTLLGRPLPAPMGGTLLQLPVLSSDPSGQTGRDYTFRMARGLMSLETGKASKILSSNGVIPKGTFPYADFDMDDPDGPVPAAGSVKYKAWVKKAIESGFLRRLDKVEEIPDFDRGVHVFGSAERAGFSDTHRKQCARCHVWGEGRNERGDLRAAGCAACHVVYGNDGKYEGEDPNIPESSEGRPHPLKHEITTAIPAAQCTHCHTRGKRIGTTYVAMFEYDYVKDGKAPPFNELGKPQRLLFTKEYLRVREDLHFKRGIGCADCHTSIDVHGDGNIYPVTYYQVEVSCYDCHGTPDRYPWELPVGYGTPVTLEGNRGVYETDDKDYLLTTKGNAKGNTFIEGGKAFLFSRYTGNKHEIPLLKDIRSTNRFETQQGKVAMSIIPGHIEKMEYYSCHAVWGPQCFGCHMQYDRRNEGIDWIETSKKLDPKTGRQTITKAFGDLSIENRSFLRWESPILGLNLKGKVSPLVPGCQVFYSFFDEAGNIKALNKFYRTSTGHNSPTLAPLFSHSVSQVARTCENCHPNPKAIGYGAANSRSAQKFMGDSPVFQDLSKGVYGDIPGAKKGTWQVPKIESFPYAPDQFVARSGEQIFNMPLPEDRPLNKEERDLVEREGLCIGCHQSYGTPEWEALVKKFGRALTAERHNEILSEALKSLMEKSQGENSLQ